MIEDNITIDKFIEAFGGNGLDNNTKQTILSILDVCKKIPSNGEYDSAIIGDRIGEYIHAIMECGKLLATLGLVEKYQETEVNKEFSLAALERAPEKGFKTDGKMKLYAQMDEKYILAKNKLNEIQAWIMYVDNYRTSLDKAQLHCKKILDRSNLSFFQIFLNNFIFL